MSGFLSGLAIKQFNLAYMGLSHLIHANGQPSAIYGVDVFALPELVFVEDVKGAPSGVSLLVWLWRLVMVISKHQIGRAHV